MHDDMLSEKKWKENLQNFDRENYFEKLTFQMLKEY